MERARGESIAYRLIIEKSKRRMIAEDIAAALELLK
jgi:hypothetical protein